MLSEKISRLFLLTMEELLKEDVVLSINRARAIITFYDGQFKDDNTDNFLYFIMYDPIKHRVILINRMALNDKAKNTRDEIPDFVVTHIDEKDITWMPAKIYKLLGDYEDN